MRRRPAPRAASAGRRAGLPPLPSAALRGCCSPKHTRARRGRIRTPTNAPLAAAARPIHGRAAVEWRERAPPAPAAHGPLSLFRVPAHGGPRLLAGGSCRGPRRPLRNSPAAARRPASAIAGRAQCVVQVLWPRQRVQWRERAAAAAAAPHATESWCRTKAAPQPRAGGRAMHHGPALRAAELPAGHALVAEDPLEDKSSLPAPPPRAHASARTVRPACQCTPRARAPAAAARAPPAGVRRAAGATGPAGRHRRCRAARGEHTTPRLRAAAAVGRASSRTAAGARAAARPSINAAAPYWR